MGEFDGGIDGESEGGGVEGEGGGSFAADGVFVMAITFARGIGIVIIVIIIVVVISFPSIDLNHFIFPILTVIMITITVIIIPHTTTINP